jgi:hypothetical protein
VIQPTILSEEFIAGLAAVWKRRNVLDGGGRRSMEAWKKCPKGLYETGVFNQKIRAV